MGEKIKVRAPAHNAPRQSVKASGAATYHHGDLRNELVREGRLVLEELGALRFQCSTP